MVISLGYRLSLATPVQDMEIANQTSARLSGPKTWARTAYWFANAMERDSQLARHSSCWQADRASPMVSPVKFHPTGETQMAFPCMMPL
jgi:hypothetical protein